jgi:hypothetical protein
MGTRFVLVVPGCECGREVDAECCLGAHERRVKAVQGVGEDGDGVGVTEAGECVAAPPGEVHGVECDVGSLVDRILRQEFGRSVVGVQAGGLVAVGGEGFALSGG